MDRTHHPRYWLTEAEKQLHEEIRKKLYEFYEHIEYTLKVHSFCEEENSYEDVVFEQNEDHRMNCVFCGTKTLKMDDDVGPLCSRCYRTIHGQENKR